MPEHSGAAGCHENALADVLLILEILRHTLLSKQNSNGLEVFQRC
jgi:hypothetical protein